MHLMPSLVPYVHDSELFTFMISTMTDKAGTITVPILHGGNRRLNYSRATELGFELR